MQRKAALGLVIALLSGGCVGTTYVPQMREDYATGLVKRGIVLHVIRPTVRAISLIPPYACDARTLQLATHGLAPTGEDMDELERFADYATIYAGGPWMVRTYSGPELEPGPWVQVETGDDTSHAAMTALNVINRYNAVAACVARSRAGR